MSAKLSISSPSIDSTMSPGLKPAAAAGLPGCTSSTRGLSVCMPKIMKIPAKITIAKMKFATGPATTMAARLATGWKTKLCSRSAAIHVGDQRAIRRAGGAVVAEEFDVAAQRNRRDFPAGAVAVVETGQFGTESDGKNQNPDAAPASDQKMANLMEKNHKA